MYWLLFSFNVNFSFTAAYSFTAVYLQLHSRPQLYSHLLQPLLTFEDAHWAELIWPQHWTSVTACLPRR